MAGQAPADDVAPLVALAGAVSEAFMAAGRTLATAESCTGGLVGHVLTEIPGASDYYLGGLISYSDQLKRDELDVDQVTLDQHGAVSAETCLAMAEGALARYGSSYAVAVTGICGPSGGSASKPVGLTYVAVVDAKRHEVRRFLWAGDRHANKISSATAALELLLDRLSAIRAGGES